MWYNIKTKTNIKTQKHGCFMITEKSLNYSKFLTTFFGLGFSTMLLRAGFYKAKGATSVQLILALCISMMLQKTKFGFVKMDQFSTSKEKKISKSALYRYVARDDLSWRSLMLQLSHKLVYKTSRLTSDQRRKCFIIDDSIYSRNRSKDTELLTRVYDHCSHKYLLGFTYLLLNWTDGNSTYPVDFALMSSTRDKHCKNKPTIKDRRLSVSKRMIESRTPKTEVVVQLLDSALKAGIVANYVLFDTWFTTAPLITAIRERGLHVIGMLKHMQNSCYLYQGQYYSLKALQQKIERTTSADQSCKFSRSIVVETKVTAKNPKAQKVKLVFVRNPNSDAKKMLTLLSTDTELSNQEIIQTYGKRWNIEQMFYTQKQLLGLVSNCRAKKYNAIIAHATIVCICNAMLEYIRRLDIDDRSIGEVFRTSVKELADLSYTVALDTLLSLFTELLEEFNERKLFKSKCYEVAKDITQNRLSSWFQEQTRYVQDFLSSFFEDILSPKINTCF